MDTEEYIALIYKNLKGIATPMEFQQLNMLSASDSKLAQLRLEIEDAWDISGEEPIVVSKEETSNLFTRIKSNGVKTLDSKSKTKTFNLRRMVTSMAAVFILLIGSYWVLKDSTKSYDEAGEYILADNSIVTLRKGSSLKVFPFNNSQRKVELIGEAYFEISKDTSSPFSVISENAKISVLGTSFLVKEKDDETFIDLTEGKINVLDKRSLDTQTMTTGMKVRLNADGKILPLNIYNNLASWKDGIIEYESVKLSSVVDEIALIFDTSIELGNQSLEDCVFSAILSDDNIKDILNRIANKFDMDVSQENTKWILSGGQCK